MTFDTTPMASRSRSASCSSDSSVDEAYFFKTYIPLSNLPTPPSGFLSDETSQQHTPECLHSLDEPLDPELLGPAIHLTNLIPSSTTLTTPSVPLVHAILMRAFLPIETIALAVCILDSLNSRFAISWRYAYPLVPTSPSQQKQAPHINNTLPEIIVLSALILAVKFVDDSQKQTATYAEDWGKLRWTCDQINYTQRVILENLSYRLLPLWNDTIILEALEDMERARRQTERAEEQRMKENETLYPTEPGIWDSEWDSQPFRVSFDGKAMSDGKAILGVGGLTPAETPRVENVGD